MADEKEVIVTSGDGGGGGAMALIAVVLVVALLVGLYLMFGQGLLNGSQDIKADIKVDTPAPNN
ncbi:MAG TPA: hypothetical protein VIT38_07730 [Allosphingosinicella sp.]|jgi:hypothetical protein